MFELCQLDAKRRIQKIDVKILIQKIVAKKIDAKIPIQKIAAEEHYNY